MINQLTPPYRVKARKTHHCNWCGKRIESGEEYRDSVNKEDDIYHWRECDRCAPYISGAIEWTNGAGRLSCDGYCPDDLREYMLESHPDVFEAWDKEDREEKQ